MKRTKKKGLKNKKAKSKANANTEITTNKNDALEIGYEASLEATIEEPTQKIPKPNSDVDEANEKRHERPKWSNAAEGRYQESESTGVWLTLTPILKKRRNDKKSASL